MRLKRFASHTELELQQAQNFLRTQLQLQLRVCSPWLCAEKCLRQLQLQLRVQSALDGTYTVAYTVIPMALSRIQVGHGDTADNQNGPFEWDAVTSFFCSDSRRHIGCVELLNTVELRVRPKFHVFGHIHESRGVTTNELGTTFVNAAICDVKYRTVNRPIVFDLPVRE